MRPVLFELPWGSMNAYGTLILLGTLASMPGVAWDAAQRGIAGERRLSFVVDFYLVLLVGAVVGGRVLHVATTPSDAGSALMRLFSLQNTGFVFFGSLVAVVAGWVWLARRYEIAFSSICDLGATWMALGHGFGRLGCAMAGCCWGAPTGDPWGVRFGAQAVVTQLRAVPLEGAHTVPLHPVQLYEAIALFGLFAVMIAARRREGVGPPLRQASRYAVGYGCIRFVTELFRADGSRGFVLQWTLPSIASALHLPADQPILLSISQAMAVGLVSAGAWGLRRTRVRPDPSPDPGMHGEDT